MGRAVKNTAAGTPLTTGIAYSQATWGVVDSDTTKGPSITVGGTPGGGNSGSSNLPAPLNALTSLLGGTGSSK
ncbi:hypothetical protein ACQP06_07205 [Nocardia sp. CA-136227]|uniref:hypothetical protein n=1 Tax=Nocardia sp. CA-136227 TaxID=3239979 RepID=UPI003D95C373